LYTGVHKISRILLFGSVPLQQAHPGSDVDLCITFQVDFEKWNLPEKIMEGELRQLIHEKDPEFGVDIVCFPEPECMTNQDYFKYRFIWQSIVNDGLIIYSQSLD
jgi:predicted nucleotidyltransferase